MTDVGIIVVVGTLISGLGLILFLAGLLSPNRRRSIEEFLVRKTMSVLFDTQNIYSPGQRLMAGGLLLIIIGIAVLLAAAVQAQTF